MRVDVEGVGVVPPHDEAEVGHRSEHRRARSDDDIGEAAQRLEKRGVAGLRTHVRREGDDLIVAQPGRTRRGDAIDIPPVGHDDDGATPRIAHRCRGVRDGGRPGIRAEQPGRDIPGTTRVLPRGKMREQAQSPGVVTPRAERRRRTGRHRAARRMTRRGHIIARCRPVGRNRAAGRRARRGMPAARRERLARSSLVISDSRTIMGSSAARDSRSLVVRLSRHSRSGVRTSVPGLSHLGHRSIRRRRLRHPLVEGLLGACVPRWDREAQDIGDGAAHASGDGLRHLPDVLGEHGLGRHDGEQRAQRAGELGGLAHADDVPGDALAVETHLDGDAEAHVIGQFGGDAVLELAVEVRHLEHRPDDGDPFAPTVARSSLRAARIVPACLGAHGVAQQRELFAARGVHVVARHDLISTRVLRQPRHPGSFGA